MPALPTPRAASFAGRSANLPVSASHRAIGRRLACALAGILFAALLIRSAAGQHKVLKIAAAADLEPVLPPLITEFQSRTGVKVEAAYASSATLATQIANGGPFDLFLAADLSFPQKVITAGLAESNAPTVYARGTLVLWARNDSPLWKLIGSPSPNAVPDAVLDALKNSSVHKIAVADATHAPYGRAAMAAIDSLGLAGALGSKLVISQNIAQAAQFVESANADAGFISLTAALTPQMQAEGRFIEVPARAYPPIMQGAVVIEHSSNREDARRFLRFLRSPSINRQLAERGLKTP